MANREARARDHLISSRRQVERRLSDLRRSINRELGAWAPRNKVWVIPLVAFACGMAVAMASRRKAKR